VLVAAAGILTGYICTLLPPPYQGPCLLVAKLLGLFGA
jgi:hypothetical protein